MQALLAARNSAATVFAGTFGALAYVILLIHGDFRCPLHFKIFVAESPHSSKSCIICYFESFCVLRVSLSTILDTEK